ncbi:MAG TPA: LLM class F420-dependent oxidoreductase [Phototrophicaceae bacterium]|nr:LLM class F420-dependent oxidoreductase [Phototrophicaceae bacterium]
MKIGLHLSSFDPANGDLRSAVKDVAQYIDDNGFYSFSPMDHFFQIGVVGQPEENMLEGYSVLNYVAAITQKLKLLTLVTGVVYRHPGILIKSVTTLDVLSGGRAYLGIGAAWNEFEARGLGIPFPPLVERFERLEETLQIAQQMWSGEVRPYPGKYYPLAQPINNPLPVSQPHPPILIGGGGEKKTLRMVAQYADACNLFAFQDMASLQHKLDVLKQHCDDVGRDFKEIELTLTGRADLRSQSSKDIIDQCERLSKLGFTHMMVIVPNVYEMRPLETLAKEVIPAVAAF